MLSSVQCQDFLDQGYLVLSQFESSGFCDAVVALAGRHLQQHIQPIEYEADVQYPGAPASLTAEGGRTARRLLQAYSRDPLLAAWARNSRLCSALNTLLTAPVYLSQCHHNCIMTKHPNYSSRTGWHRDSRYWNFSRPALVSAWLALGDEQPENGCLWVIPGSQRHAISPAQLDQQQFLRTDLPENQQLLDAAIPLPLRKGDLLLFHSNLFHAAGRNTTDKTKYSLVFTYRDADNPPLPDTRSSALPDILMD